MFSLMEKAAYQARPPLLAEGVMLGVGWGCVCLRPDFVGLQGAPQPRGLGVSSESCAVLPAWPQNKIVFLTSLGATKNILRKWGFHRGSRYFHNIRRKY